VNERLQRLAAGRVASSGQVGLLVLALLVAMATGCARMERAEDAGHEKAVQLEEERVLSDLQRQEAELRQILEGLQREEQAIEGMQRREAAGESVPAQEREQATRELRRLTQQLREEKERHAETLRDAEKLGIAPRQSP